MNFVFVSLALDISGNKTENPAFGFKLDSNEFYLNPGRNAFCIDNNLQIILMAIAEKSFSYPS
jgi:hypothetical protein